MTNQRLKWDLEREQAEALRRQRRAYLNHTQDALNDAHSTLCDLVTIVEQRDWRDSETALLVMIDTAIRQCHEMRIRDTKPL